MSALPRKEWPRALTHYFDPPERFLGEFGWVCGFSADAPFLENAIERFTGLTTAMRAKEGLVALAVMLDPSNAHITPIDVPGLLHAPYVVKDRRPFRLLHAKVALLGFRHETDVDDYVVRLVVSTGNWTRDTLERSLDLAWCTEIRVNELKDGGRTVEQSCADIHAANTLFDWLRARFDCQLLDAPPGRDVTDASLRKLRLDQWITVIERARGAVQPRFFHNLGQSLLDQLPEQVRGRAGGTLRNRVLLGSGFFETGQKDDESPAKALARIVEKLRSADTPLVTKSPTVDVYVNRKNCGALAHNTFSDTQWSIREGRWPRQPERTLHAKFIFSGFWQHRTDSCGSAWLYLGSGNLTGPGFLSKAHPHAGNLEAGVVIALSNLTWDEVQQKLPVSFDDKLKLTADQLEAGVIDDDGEDQFVAAPIYALQVVEEAGQMRLVPLPTEHAPVAALDLDGTPCEVTDGGYAWAGDIPRMVRVEWLSGDDTQRALVPVLDPFGRVSGTTLERISLDEAWDDLASFPLLPIDEEPNEYGDDRGQNGTAPRSGQGESRYAVRRLMQLVENIAAAQCAISEMDWRRWCIRLEQTLTRAAEGEVVAQGCKLGLNVLSPLYAAPFRPDFAQAGTKHGQQYEATLDVIARSWGMDQLEPIGVHA